MCITCVLHSSCLVIVESPELLCDLPSAVWAFLHLHWALLVKKLKLRTITSDTNTCLLPLSLSQSSDTNTCLLPLSLSTPGSRRYGHKAGRPPRPPCPCKPEEVKWVKDICLFVPLFVCPFVCLSICLFVMFGFIVHILVYIWKLTEHCILFFSSCKSAFASFNFCLSAASWAWTVNISWK